MTSARRSVLVFLALLSAGHVHAVEPSPVEATGVINAAHGANSSNWDTPPYSSYAFTETDKIFPTLLMSPGDGPVWPLPYAENRLDLSALDVKDPATGRSMALLDFLDRRLHNDGLIVIHKQRIVHESYRNNLTPQTRHIVFSVSKSLVSLVARIALQQGLFDEHELASKYVPELRGKEAWTGVTVRHVWDMRDGIKFTEDYDDENSDVRRQDRATGWRTHDPQGIRGMREFLRQHMNERAHAPGTRFNYASPQTEVLTMIVEGASGQPFAEFFEDHFWAKLGAAGTAGFATDGYGHALAQGGISTTLRDLARVALLVRNRGQTDTGEQLVDVAFFDDLLTPTDELRRAFGYRNGAQGDSYYRSMFWVVDPDARRFQALGVHGNFMYFDLENDLVLVALASYPVAVDLMVQLGGPLIAETILHALEGGAGE